MTGGIVGRRGSALTRKRLKRKAFPLLAAVWLCVETWGMFQQCMFAVFETILPVFWREAVVLTFDIMMSQLTHSCSAFV